MSCGISNKDVLSAWMKFKGFDKPSLSLIINELKRTSGINHFDPSELDEVKITSSNKDFQTILNFIFTRGKLVITKDKQLEYAKYILDEWNKGQENPYSIEDNSKRVTEELEELPSIKLGLSNIFVNPSAVTKFKGYTKASIIAATVMNNGNEVVSNRELNNSLINLQNRIGRRLAKQVGLEEKDIYNGNVFDKTYYNKLVTAARAFINPFLKDGKLNPELGNNRTDFYDYILLTQFDDIMEMYIPNIRILPSLKGNRNIPSGVYKYGFNNGDNIVWGQGDSIVNDDINKHTNNAVKNYITSLREINRNNVFTGNQVLFRDFNALVGVILNSNAKDLKDLRSKPSEAIPKIFDEIYNNIEKFLSGENKCLRNTFYTIYRNIFDKDNYSSLLATNRRSSKVSKNDLYYMICNHFNKSTTMDYYRMAYELNPDYNSEKKGSRRGWYVTKMLTSSNYDNAAYNIKSRLTILPVISSDYSKIRNEYKVSFNKKEDVILDVSFTIGEDTIILKFDGTKSSVDEKILDKIGVNELYTDFFNKVFGQNYNTSFYKEIKEYNTNNIESSNTNGLQALFKLAANVLLSNELGFDTKSNISNKISNYISDSSNWYNDNLNCIDPTKLGSVRDAIDLLSYGISYLNKDFTKSYITLSDGAHMPKFGLSSLNASDRYLFDNITIDESSPFYYNLLFNNRAFRDKMKNIYKTEVINRDGVTKQISEMKTEELIYNALVSEYFSGNDEFYIIQPAVYADKTKIQSKMIDAKEKFEFVYIDENGNTNTINKSFSEMTLDDLYNLHYGTVRPQIQKLKENIEKDYKTLFSILHELYPNKYPKNLPTDYEGFITLLNKLTEGELYNGLKAIQVRNPDGNFTFVDQIHYVNNKGKFESNNLLQYYFKRYITNSKEEYNNKVKLEERWFAESIRQFEVRLDLVFSDGSINYAIQDRIDKVKNQDQKDYIKSKTGKDISATYEELWIDKNTQTLIPYLIVKDGKLYYDENIDLTSDNIDVVLNPELARYKAIDNLVSDSYNLATVGLPFAHPSKVKATDLTASGIKAEEAARTTAFTKRQVVDGATGHNVILNKLDGIPSRVKIACIKDLSELTASIAGNTGEADIADGALRVSPFFHHWFANSSPELQHSTTHEKPLGYFHLPNYLGSSLWKCASFAITNEWMRNSITSKINGEALLKMMTDKEWPIEKLDLSSAINPLLLINKVYFCNPNEDLNTHYQLKSVKYLGDNNYNVTYTAYDNEGNALNNNVIQKQVSINSNYDLWKLFGGAYSESRINGRFIFDEKSTELVATVGNKITITDKDIPENIPKSWIIQNGNIRIFQPMKYSDIHYLNNTSGVKVGATNINPSSLYHRPIIDKISKGELVFAHSTIGKSFASKMGYNIIDFDTQYAKELKLAKEELNQNEDRNLYINKLISLLNSAVNSGKTVLFSDIELLDAISDSDSFNVSKILTLNNDEYNKRYLEREGTIDTATSKELIDAAINKYLGSHENTKLIDSSNMYIQDYLDSPLLYSYVDPSYLIIQLTADHEVDNAVVSEMTQVIAAMEQKAETHDIAIKMYESIGSFISAKLRLYEEWDINTEAGKAELNTILGKTLCRIFKNDDEAINLATAIISSVKEELSKSGKISKPIPFDDNNIISKFEINIKNGFTKDIIKRKFDGFAGVMTPGFDMYSIYDTPEGNVYSANSLIDYGRKNGKSNIQEILEMLDVEVPGYKIRMGDWVEIDGKAQQVGSLNSTLVDGGITLAEVRSLPSVKKLGSKGRNIRAQNYEVIVSPENINSGRSEFDLYDLDSVNFIYNLKDFIKNFEKHKANNSLLYQIFLEINNNVEYKDENGKLNLETLINPKEVDRSLRDLTPYVKESIQKDLRSIADGFYPIPINFRVEDTYATILTSKYSPNEIAVDKPFADKFLLEAGDNLSDVNVDFFINKLTNRGRTNLDKEYWTAALIGKNYKLHFVSSEQFKNLKNNVKDITKINIDSQKIMTPENTYRVIEDTIYPVTNNMEFYKVTISGESFEIVVGASVENIREIYKTNNFYIADFNITTENKKLLDLYNEINHTDYPNLDSFKKINRDNKREVEIKRQAKKMYQSFKEACKVIAARIPAQSMQSFMNMKIVAFTNFGTNVVQTPLEMLIFEGSDFDIDKIYVMMSSISKNGIYSDWSPYFNYYSDNNFNIARTLPLPSRIKYQIGSKEDINKDNSNTVDVSEYADILDLYNIYNKNRSDENIYKLFIGRFNSLMNIIKDKTRIYSETRGLELLNLINKHTMYKYNESEVIKNIIFNYMYNIGSNPKNYLSETSVLTVAPAREAAEKSSMGKFGNNNSNENPGAKMNSQDQNMVGKSSIAVYANGIKAFSSLLLFFQDKLTNIDKVNNIFDIKLNEFFKIINADLQKIIKNRPDLAEYIEEHVITYTERNNEFSLDDSLDIYKLYNVYKPYADLAILISKYEKNPNITLEDLNFLNSNNPFDSWVISGKYLEEDNNYMTAIKNLVYLHYYKDIRRFKIGGKEYKFQDDDGEFTIKLSNTLPNINILSNPSEFLTELKNDILNNKIQEDVYETLGIMLNVSTDNAKELVLEKINGAGKLANVYIYLIASGASFNSITRFMTSKLINAVGKEANSSLFKEDTKYNNLKRAIYTYRVGVNLSNFIPSEHISDAVNKLEVIIKNLGIKYHTSDNRAKFTEKFGTLSAKEIEQIISYIRHNNIKFNLGKRRTKEEAEFDDDEYTTIKLKESTFLINRFLNKALSRAIILGDNRIENNNTLDTLSIFADGGQEISTYSQLCGINQGVKALRNEYFTRLQTLEKFISDRINQSFVADSPEVGESTFTYYNFDFLRFISDEDYRNDAILKYETSKTSFNILEAISSSPHLKEMYRAMYVSDHLLSSFSYKYNLYKKLINDSRVSFGDIRGEDRSKIITGFINDLVTAEFFDRLGININLNNPITVYNPDFSDSLSNIKSLTLNNVFNRATFKRWMESYVIPTLKRDYPNNTFIKDLTPDSTRSQIGSTKIFYKLPVDLNKVVGDYNEVLYDNYVLDFNNLRQFKFEGNNIGDLFFIYNLLISNNSFGGKTITRIFEDMVREADSNSIISKFLEFESNLSNLNIDYDINDLNIRFKPQKRVNILSNSSEVETSDGKTFEVFTKDNTSMLFFRDKTNKEFSRKVNTVHDKLMELFDNDKIQIKLSCDE